MGEPREPKEPKGDLLIWERPEPSIRAALAPLSRERIVDAAIGLADAEGVAGVSLRKVAAVLDTRPMRLYGWLSTKEDLLDLMVDAVYGKMDISASSGDWRADVRAMANETRRMAKRHPWFIELLSGRPRLGPHALRNHEAVLSAFGDRHIDVVLRAAAVIDAYVIGAINLELAEERAERISGMNHEQWQHAMGPYMAKVLASGDFPMLTKVMRDASHPGAAAVFAVGLDAVLDGVALRMGL
ncbi:TetR/AcrR family transcriptional regulator C-terminal domain-containing protein [Pendulispora albinea]|uniref:TetR/AcrR family transcriptional regulator C-terminal domain-containing protein n=1 Tax=Pendulispora albinea TaxID=2741071 RepID=A0ABZ2M1J9_9BACT